MHVSLQTRQVHIYVKQNKENLVSRIEDDGPGLEEEEIADVLNRGARLDESVPGSGLGLGIVKDILDTYQGELIFARSKLGGLHVKVTIPIRSQNNQIGLRYR